MTYVNDDFDVSKEQQNAFDQGFAEGREHGKEILIDLINWIQKNGCEHPLIIQFQRKRFEDFIKTLV